MLLWRSVMIYRIAADLVLVVHLLFIAFVVSGAFLAWRWPRIMWVQLPAVVYGAVVESVGFTLPADSAAELPDAPRPRPRAPRCRAAPGGRRAVNRSD